MAAPVAENATLIENGKVPGVYNNTAVSYGLQAGLQTFAEAMFLTTDAAVNDPHSRVVVQSR
jgi:hypothetical protein